MALWPGDRAISIAQALLSFVVWSILALVIARPIRSAVVRRLVVVVILLIPCTAQIANWDAVIQGDSVSISAGVLALALLLRFAQAPSWGRAAGFVAAALWYSMTRPNTFVLLVVWAIGMIVIGVIRRQAVLWCGVAAALLLISFYSYVYNVRSDQAWVDAYGVSRTTIGYAYPVGQFDPVARSVIADLHRSDAPSCMIPPTPGAVSHSGTTRWARATSAACPGMNEWATNHWTHWWANWLLHHPGPTASILWRILPDSLSPSVWGTVHSPVPDEVGQILFGSPALAQSAQATRSYRTEPLLLWLAAALVISFAGRSRLGGRRGAWSPDALLGLTVFGSFACAASSALIIQTVPFEVAQESLGAAVLLTVSVVAAVALGVDRLVSPPAPEAAEANPG